MLTIRQTLLSMFLLSVGTVAAQETDKTTCTPTSYSADPHLDYLIFIERSKDFCTKLVDGKFADATVGYRDPVVSISFTRSSLQGSDCGKLKREDCLNSLKGLADICKDTQTFEYPTDQTTFLQGTSSLPTTCGTYKVVVAPIVTRLGGLGSNSTVPSPSSSDTSGKGKDPSLTDNSNDNAYVSEWADDGSGYVRKGAAGKVGVAFGGWWALGVVGVVGFVGFW